MKILFIYPNSGSQIGFNYGVAYLAGVLNKAGHEVAFTQLCDDIGPLPTKEQFAAYLEQEAPDMIGFSVVTNQWALTVQYAGWCREISKAPLICGGIHATISPDEILNDDIFDFVIVGECEDALLRFINAWEKNEDWRKTPNLGFKGHDGPVMNPVCRLPDLTGLPPKNYEIFDFQKIIDGKNGWVGLMASRGCPFKCSYCFNHLMVKKYRGDLDCSFADLNYIRHHSVDQMMDEIRYLENNYKNISMYILDDDLFTFRKKYVLEFCEAYKKVSKIPFVVNGHVGFWDEERAAALSEAGCSIVKFGVESGSEKIRRQVMNRQTSNKKIIEAVNIVGKYGMHSSCFLMIGLPHETEEDVMDTIRLMADSRPGRFRWTFFYPFPGTQAYTIADEGGFINYDKFHSFTNFTDDSCLEFGAEQDLLLRKIGRIMPWFVNAHSGRECSAFYMDKVQWLLAMDEGEWEKHAPTLLDLDKEYSAKFAAEGKPHFAVKYNRFMGVDSDYFLNPNVA